MRDLPFVHKFQSLNGKCYVYDCNTQEIAMVDSPLYDLIDQPALLGEKLMHETRRNTYRMADVDDVHKSLESAREKGLFLPRVKSRMVTPACDECMDHVIAGASGKLVLNITRDCNLRCTYCCFSGLYPKYHRHQSVSMPHWVQ